MDRVWIMQRIGGIGSDALVQIVLQVTDEIPTDSRTALRALEKWLCAEPDLARERERVLISKSLEAHRKLRNNLQRKLTNCNEMIEQLESELA
jgi:hypothetical protein